MNKQVLGWLRGLGPYRLVLQGVPNYPTSAHVGPYARVVANDNAHLSVGFGGPLCTDDRALQRALLNATLTRELLGVGPSPHYSRR